MTTQVTEESKRQRREDWLRAIERLMVELESWCEQLGWPTARETKHFDERAIGEYDAPLLRARMPAGHLYITPIALDVIGARGRVDIEAWPSLNRVKLIRDGETWRITTDSNVQLHEPWNHETFARVAQELAA